MIRKNLRGLVANKEYSRLPYWTDDEYVDVQCSTSQKYVQDSFGKFAESEMQQPYKGDPEDDYQAVEYNYATPQMSDNDTDVPIDNTKPRGFCEDFWDSFGLVNSTNEMWRKLDLYQAYGCPMTFNKRTCCTKNMSITGPSEVAVNKYATFAIKGGDPKCLYNFEAVRGHFGGDQYHAPATAGTDTITISPFTGFDARKTCPPKKVINITGTGCLGKIGYTTLQMSTSGTQTLTVTDPGLSAYSWATTTGSIVPSTGNSVTFTAPSSNANCASNPTITLTCGGNVVDTITIAISITNNYKAYTYKETWPQEPSNPCGDQGGSCHGAIYYFRMTAFDCMGQPYKWSGTPVTCTSYWCNGAAPCTQESEISCYGLGTLGPFPGSMQDNRTAAQKAAGCCPAALL